MAELLTVAEAAAASKRHPVTLRRALESGELHGGQRVPGGRWTVARECLEAWALGAVCDHRRE